MFRGWFFWFFREGRAGVDVLDRPSLPRAVRVTEVGAQADLVFGRLVPRELTAAVMDDGVARFGGDPAQLSGDAFGCDSGILAVKL